MTLAGFHVRDRDPDSVISAVRFGRFTPAWISPPCDPWVSVFPGPAESFDPKALNLIGSSLSRALKTHVWSVFLNDSRTLLYTVFMGGEILAEYDSFPELAPAAGKSYRASTGGNPVLIHSLCPGRVHISSIEKVLYRVGRMDAMARVLEEEKVSSEKELYDKFPDEYIMARLLDKRGYAAEEERLADLATYLDVPHALLSFSMLEGYFQENKEGLVLGEEEFIRVAR